jgi:Cu+-exporting ATPase
MRIPATSTTIDSVSLCYHCGEPIVQKAIEDRGKHFCCSGCQMVYALLEDHELCGYYDLGKHSGLRPEGKAQADKFDFLDEPNIQSKLVQYQDAQETHITLFLPAMHCSSCIWLLEHLHKLNAAVISATVDFPAKSVHIAYRRNEVKLSEVAALVYAIGYEPSFSMRQGKRGGSEGQNRRAEVLKIGIAGFAFGNIMMMSFPDYFSIGLWAEEERLAHFFRWACLGLSLPVLTYSANSFFISAWKSMRSRHLNIDFPIALAILFTFGHSIVNLLWLNGPGYFDSMTGIVFFMLVGRYVQNKTYDAVSFDRDYTSYFPIACKVLRDGKAESIPLADVRPGLLLLIRSHEIVPADSVLVRGRAMMDYSFVTGESRPVRVEVGEKVFAGGRQLGATIELLADKAVSQSYLTRLWNNPRFEVKKVERPIRMVESINRWFSWAVLGISLATFLFWALRDWEKAFSAATSILIIACPCALLLSSSFAFGNALNLAAARGLFLRNAASMENMANATTLVFDKTGTLTTQGAAPQWMAVEEWTDDERNLLALIAAQSGHPMSQALAHHLGSTTLTQMPEIFEEVLGKGIAAEFCGVHIRIGSADWVGCTPTKDAATGSVVYARLENKTACLLLRSHFREGIGLMLQELSKNYKLYVLSGDNNSEKKMLLPYFSEESLRFHQSPQEKMAFVEMLQQSGQKVLMLGDGLNDAGALAQADVGIAVSDSVGHFSPACDGILDGNVFGLLPQWLAFVKNTRKVVLAGFIYSILFNAIGLFFAVQGDLQPIVAAVLMPCSSIGIVLLTTGAVRLLDRGLRRKKKVFEKLTQE